MAIEALTASRRRTSSIGAAAALAAALAILIGAGAADAQLRREGETQILVPSQGAPARSEVPTLLSPEAPPAPEGGPRNVIPWLEDAINAPDGAGGGVQDGGAFVGEDGAPIDAILGEPAAPPSSGVFGGPQQAPSEPLPFELQPPASDARAPESVGGPGGAIETAPLETVRSAAAGVISAASLGLPIDAWRGSNASDAAEVVDGLAPGPLRAANLLAIDLLSAAFEPPATTPARLGGGRDLLSARIDALARFGAVDRAAQLAEAAGAARLAKAADIAFVAGLEDRACGAVLGAEGAEPLQRAFCLAVAGDPIGAQLAISANRGLGAGDEETLILLEAVADPSLTDLVSAPASLRETTPLRLAGLRRLGLSPPPDFSRVAPLELLPAAADRSTPPRQRLEALERLEASGAVSTDALRAAFDQSASAESGGVWGRVEGYRRAVAAPLGRFASAAARALETARDARRAPVMARLLSAEAARRVAAPGGALSSTSETRRILWLGGQWEAATQFSGVDALIEDRALAAITAAPAAGFGRRAGGDIGLARVGSTGWVASDAEPLFARAARGDERAARMAAGLLALGAPTDNPGFFEAAPELAFAAREGRLGEIAFGAVAALGGDAPVTGAAVFAALSNLVAVGLDDAARAIAVEAALLP